MNVRLEDDLDFSTICTLPKSNNVNAKRKLRLECRDGECFDVSFAVAKMSPKLREMIHRYAHTIGPQGIFSVNIGDLPSRGVFHALAYCRCLYLQKSTGDNSAIQRWNAQYGEFCSKLLCELASAAYHLDIQSLVDQTCRSIALLMSASDTASELKERFELDSYDDIDQGYVAELRETLATLDMSIIEEQIMSSDEYDALEEQDLTQDEQFVTLGQYSTEPSVEELLGYINGTTPLRTESKAGKRSAKKRKKGKKKAKSVKPKEDLHNREEKMKMAAVDPAAIFDESKFEDDEGEAEVESFRQVLEDAHKQATDVEKISLQVPFVPDTVFSERSDHLSIQ